MKALRYIFLALILAALCLTSIADDFDYSSRWDWKQLMQQSKSPRTNAVINNLRNIISRDDGHYILYQLSKMKPAHMIYQLSDLEKEQAEWGGGFYGLIPDYFADRDSMIVPDDFANLMESALALALIRKNNYEIISNPDFEYPIKFSGTQFKLPANYESTGNWNLNFDFSFLDNLLTLFDREEVAMDEALRAASNPAIIEMLNHRRSLGYIPEPLPDTTDMARFIFHAASSEPVDMIWKWLNPWNDFCMADIYMNQKRYRELLDTLKANQSNMEKYILGRMYSFAPVNIDFSDRVSFAVNWGIRSWATENGLGTNIVQFKDNYPAMFRTMTHETFHRLQLQVCPVDSSRFAEGATGFDDLVFYDFPIDQDRKFYEAITYIMLEGTATFVGRVDSAWNETEKMRAGMTLLDQLYQAVYVDSNLAMADEFVNKGLKSNGPFYGLGYYMSKQIVEASQKSEIGNLLQKGSPAFFQYYQQAWQDLHLPAGASFSQEILAKINQLAEFIGDSE